MGAPVKTFSLANFSGGLDLREGVFVKDQNRFSELLNLYVTVGKKIRRRPPLGKYAGAYDTANAQGFIQNGGNWYTIAKKGVAPVHTVVGVTLNVLYFDNPDYCTTWTLLQAVVQNGYVCALIRHTFPGATVLHRDLLHVFDAKLNKPTYVEDPACPTSWNPNFPLHTYGAGTLGAYDGTFAPVIGVGTNKLWMSRPDGNAACSAIDRPRVWNTRTDVEFQTGGEWWYFIIPNNGASLREFIVSENYATLPNWAGFVLEYLDANNAWQKFTEDDVAPPTVDKHYCTVSIASRFAGGYANEVKLQVFWTGATDVVIRWRAMVTPPVAALTGCGYTSGTDTLAAGTFTFEGNNYILAGGVIGASSDGSVPAGSTVYSTYMGFGPQSLGSNNSVGAFKITAGNGNTERLNGWRRYYAFLEFQDDENTLIPSSRTAVYSYQGTAGKETAWYFAKIADYTLNLQGFGEAAYLNTAAYNPFGGTARSIKFVNSFMLFSYESVSQLWISPSNPAQSAFQAVLPIGVGSTQTRPMPVDFYGSVMLPTITGMRGFALVPGYSSNSLQDNNVGEPIQSLVLPDLQVATYWAFLGLYITAGVKDGAVVFYALSYSRESKISAWSTWTCAGLTQIEAMIAVNDRIYLKSGTGIYSFNGSQVLGTAGWRDSNDVAGDGNAYRSRAVWHYNDMQQPSADKEFIELELVQTGIGSIDFGFVPNDPTLLAGEIMVPGTTFGNASIPLSFSGSAVAPVIESTDETGYQLEGMAMRFRFLQG